MVIQEYYLENYLVLFYNHLFIYFLQINKIFNQGVSDDWAKGNATIKYAYTLELSPGDVGTDSCKFIFF